MNFQNVFGTSPSDHLQPLENNWSPHKCKRTHLNNLSISSEPYWALRFYEYYSWDFSKVLIKWDHYPWSKNCVNYKYIKTTDTVACKKRTRVMTKSQESRLLSVLWTHSIQDRFFVSALLSESGSWTNPNRRQISKWSLLMTGEMSWWGWNCCLKIHR